LRLTLAVLVGIALIGGVAAALAFRPRLPPAERGRRLAERMGCFSCHGPGGIRGAANPGRTDKTVPTLEGDVMMYAKTPEEIHEWIDDGVSKKRAQSKTWRAQRDSGTIRMPAFERRLSDR